MGVDILGRLVILSPVSNPQTAIMANRMQVVKVARLAMKNHIESVRIEIVADEDPDTSYLGEYSHEAKPFFIDRRELGVTDRHEYRYFNPGSVERFDPAASWIPADCADKRAYWLEAMKKNAQQDFARMESFNRGEWGYVGIIAKAVVRSPNGVLQTLRSGGLWGIESDSDKDYLASVKADELSNLRAELESFGFGKRAIDKAFENVTERG